MKARKACCFFSKQHALRIDLGIGGFIRIARPQEIRPSMHCAGAIWQVQSP